MASFLGAVSRLLFRRQPREGRAHLDEENAPPPAMTAGDPRMSPTNFSSTLGPGQNIRSYHIPDNDALATFRLLVGITTTPYLGFAEKTPIGSRPAPNIGLYARVVHSEQKAKDSFKVFSIVINACYFLQIVIAAALTAMGAANADNRGITALGAINTIMAGFLTFLKGSGLPGRLKYYGAEWKKIREFIEQRERDFSREGCSLNVYEVVEMIEQMYNNTKQDIEMNTPDSYNSISNVRHLAQQNSGKIGGVDVQKLDGLASKLHGLDSTVRNMMSGAAKKKESVVQALHDHEKQLDEDVHDFEKEVAKDIEEHKSHVASEATMRRAQAEEAIAEGRHSLQTRREQLAETGGRIVRDVQDIHRAIQEHGKHSS